jgi:hypothetical protein
VISEGSRVQGVKGSSDPPQNRRIKRLKNYKELKVWQRPYELCLEIYTITAKSSNEEIYGQTSQILLAGDLDLIEKGELGPLNKDIAEIERMLKALIKSLENKPLNPDPLDPWTLFSN